MTEVDQRSSINQMFTTTCEMIAGYNDYVSLTAKILGRRWCPTNICKLSQPIRIMIILQFILRFGTQTFRAYKLWSRLFDKETCWYKYAHRLELVEKLVIDFLLPNNRPNRTISLADTTDILGAEICRSWLFEGVRSIWAIILRQNGMSPTNYCWYRKPIHMITDYVL